MDNNPINPQQPTEPTQQTPTQTTGAPQGAVYSPVVVPGQKNASGILKNKKLLIIAGAGIGAVLLLLVVALTFGSSSEAPVAKDDNDQSTENMLLEPARAIDIEQINNSISQDISTMNDDSQLPANRLDDKTLGL